ncbi:MAG: hypothetical protein MUC63_01470, partial [Planctomycetes bacterium]|nr:hypothetical protein [Planctomycetota bacterium]
FNYDPPVTCMGVREAEVLLLLQILKAGEDGGVRVSVTLQTDFKELELAIREALSTARDALKAGKPGEAIRQYRTIVDRYPFHREAGKAKEELARLEAEAEAQARRVESRFDLAQFFRNLLEMEAALGDAGAFGEKYAGSAREEAVRNLGDRIRLAIQDQRVRQGQAEAEGFLLRAREHRARGEAVLAGLLYRHVAKLWPGTEWAKTAETEAQALAEGAKKEGD